LLHDLICQLRHDFKRLDRICNLLDLRCPRNGRADMRVLDNPRQSKSSLVTSQLLGNWLKLPDLCNLRLPDWITILFFLALGEVIIGVCYSAIFGNAIVVFSRQNASLQWGEGCKAGAIVLVQQDEFFLDLFAS